MPIFEITEINSDACGNEWVDKQPYYVELDNMQEALAIFGKKRGFFRFGVKELTIRDAHEVYAFVSRDWK